MRDRSRAVKAAIITFIAGAVLIAAILVLTLSVNAPARVVHIGNVGPNAETGGLGRTINEPTICQAGEVLPSGVSAIRVSVWGFYGAHIHLMVYRGSQLITQGSRAADWTGSSVTIPVQPVSRTVSGVRVCFSIGPNSEPLEMIGHATSELESAVAIPTTVLTNRNSLANVPAQAKVPIGGRFTIEYVATAPGSWWSRILTVARHMGLGRSYSGTWIALLVAALMACACALSVRLTLRELR